MEAIDEISIGYRVLDWTEKDGIRMLEKEVIPIEISIVTRAANELRRLSRQPKRKRKRKKI